MQAPGATGAVVDVVVDDGVVVEVDVEVEVEVEVVVDGGGAAQLTPPAGTWAWDSMWPMRTSARWLVGSGTRSLMRTTSTAAAASVPLPAVDGGPGLAVSSPMALGSSPMLIEPSGPRSMCWGIAPGPNRACVVSTLLVAASGGVMRISGVVGDGLPAGAYVTVAPPGLPVAVARRTHSPSSSILNSFGVFLNSVTGTKVSCVSDCRPKLPSPLGSRCRNDFACTAARSVGVPMSVAITGLLIEPSALAVPVSSSCTSAPKPRPNATSLGSATLTGVGPNSAWAWPRNSDA